MKISSPCNESCQGLYNKNDDEPIVTLQLIGALLSPMPRNKIVLMNETVSYCPSLNCLYRRQSSVDSFITSL